MAVDEATLLARRRAVVDWHRTLESVPGSGWHRDDAQPRETRDRGLARLSDRPVGIQDDDLVYFCGPDVAAVTAALRGFVEKTTAGDPERLADRLGESGLLRHALKVARRYADRTDAVLTVPSQDYNGCLFALADAGIVVVGADLRG